MIPLSALAAVSVASPSPVPALPRSTAAPARGGFVVPRAAQPVPHATPALFATPAPEAPGVVLPPVPALTTPAPINSRLPDAGIVGTSAPFVGLSLADAIGMALARNTDLAVSQADRRIAGYQIVAAKGAFDLNLQVQPSYSFKQIPPISTFATGPNGTPEQQIDASGTLGVAQRTYSGGLIQASTQAQRFNDNNPYDTYNPYYEAAFSISYAQPLARNRAIDAYREQIQLAKVNADLTNDAALLTASNTIDSVSIAYDNLVAAWKNVAIEETALLQAKAQSQSNARLVRRGESAPIDVVQSDEQVSEFQNDVYSAIANVSQYQNQLKTLILSDPVDAIWTANLVPTTPVGSPPDEPSLESTIVAALDHRPEVSQLRDDLRQQNVTIGFDKNQTLPQIDLNFGVTELGFAGAPQNLTNTPLFSVLGQTVTDVNALVARANATAPPGTAPLVPINGGGLAIPLEPGTTGKIGTAYTGALAGKFPQYTVSATLAFPLQNRTAEATYKASVEQRRVLLTRELALVQRVQFESRNALQSLRSARSRLITATAARVAAEKVAASEVRRFRAGESTTYLVLQRQVMLANERLRELQAQTDIQNAIVELDRVTGDNLAKNGVTLRTLGTAPQGPVPRLPAPVPKP